MQQNIKSLMSICQQYGIKLLPFNKIVIIPIYCFINQLLTNLKKYLHQNLDIKWQQYIVINQKIRSQQNLSNLVGSWFKHRSNSLQCQLISRFLNCEDKNKIRLFIKLRKNTVALGNVPMLDQILLKHQDIIGKYLLNRGILYKSIKSQNIRKNISNGIKRLFISYKLAQPKIYACVFIQYVLSLSNTFQHQNHQARINDIINKPIKKNLQTQQIGNQQFHSSIHQENGLYRKVQSPSKLKILQKKFIQPKSYNSDENSWFKSKLDSNVDSGSRQIINYSQNKPSRFLKNSDSKKLTKSVLLKQQQEPLLQIRKLKTKLQFPQQNKYSRYTQQGKQIKLQTPQKYIKIESSQIHQKPFGYETWLNMIQSNKQFKQRMLKPNVNNNSYPQSLLNATSLGDLPIYEQDQSIKQIKDSLIKRKTYMN